MPFELCGVCGDQACGFNFGAITCKSCKAFFRRNVMKQMQFKCYLGDNCHIDMTNRKSCKKCRLMKCLAIGMKMEIILTEEEKQIRKLYFDLNRRKRQINKSPKIVELEPQSDDIETNNIFEIIENDSFDSFDINQEILEIESYLSDHSIADSSDTGYQSAIEFESELALISIDRPITDYRNNFNELEGNKLAELFNATNYLQNPITKNKLIVNNIMDAVHAMRDFAEYKIKKIVEFSKNLCEFKNLYEDDQITLIKYGAIEIGCLRLFLDFNFETNSWNVLTDGENSTEINLNLYLDSHLGHRLYHKSFIQNMGQEWDSDIIIINLLTAILLFNPNRPKLIHKEVVELQQKTYIYLLQRYLLLRYRSEYVSNSKFMRLMNYLPDLSRIDGHISTAIRFIREKTTYFPLLQEILSRDT